MNWLTAQIDLCIGYNSLSDTGDDSETESTHNDEEDSQSTKHVKDKPKGARTWTWVCTIFVLEHSANREKRSGSTMKTQNPLGPFVTWICSCECKMLTPKSL